MEIIPELGIKGVKFTFIYDDPAEKMQKLNNWEKEINLGLKTINEVRVEMGLNEVPWGVEPSNRMISMEGQNNFPKKEGSENKENGTKETSSEEEASKETKQEEDNSEGKPKKKEEAEKSFSKKIKEMDYDELIAEHKKLVAILESEDPEKIKEEAKEQKKELEQYIREASKKFNICSHNQIGGITCGVIKGVDDGQYYREPTYRNVQPPDQPQNEVLRETTGSELTCPVCGMNTLSIVTSADDVGREIQYRCTNCSSMINESEIKDNETQNEMFQIMSNNPYDSPISLPEWSPHNAECPYCKSENISMEKFIE
jgi:hypothetical protein